MSEDPEVADDEEILIGVPVRAHQVIVERVEGWLSRDVRGHDFAPRVIEIGVRDERAWLEPATEGQPVPSGARAISEERGQSGPRALRTAHERAATRDSEGELHEQAAHGTR